MARKPSHPGALLREVVLPETNLTVTELAKRCGVARNTMSKLVNERSDVTEDIAIRLSRVVGSTPQFWLHMQTKRNLWQLERERKEVYRNIKRLHVA